MQKITKILQNRLLKLQKFKNALILFQINEIQLFHYSAVSLEFDYRNQLPPSILHDSNGLLNNKPDLRH